MRSKALLAVTVVIIVIAAGAFVALAPSSQKTGSGKLQVVASFYPLYYFASSIGGDRADVSTIIPNNMEPHSFDPRPSDIIRVSQSDLLIYNGAGFEPWIGSLMAQIQGNPTIVDTSANLTLLPSETVTGPYAAAQDLLDAGNSTSLLLESGAASIGGNSSLFHLTLLGGAGSYNGTLSIAISAPGDYRFIFKGEANLTVLQESGEVVDPEMVVGAMARFPDFSQGYFMGFEEFPPQNYTLEISSANQSIDLAVIQWVESGTGHNHGLNDPHLWLDPLAAKAQVRNILAGFKAADPGNSSYYQSNADALSSKLDQLNLDFENSLMNRTKNAIITTHEGFDYLASRYGFVAYAAVGISGEEQPSIQDIVNLTNMVRSLSLHYVYSEPIYSDQVIQTIAMETQTQILVLDGAHGRMGIHSNMDYMEIMYANLEALRIGLEVGS